MNRLNLNRFRGALFCLLLLCSPISFANELADDLPPAVVNVSTDPASDDEIWVGSRVRLIIDVLGREGWANLPTMPTFDIPGAIVYQPDGQSTRLNDTVEGESYSGQRNEWWVYPRRSGRLKIPEIEIDIAIKTFDPKNEAQSILKQTQSIALDVVPPPGVTVKEADVVITSKLNSTQAWQGDFDSIKVGDGITRTITRTIEGSPPLVLPPIVFTEIEGATRYLKQPETSLKSNRGDLTGTRTDSVTYVFKRQGEMKLPPITVSWFDSVSKAPKSQTLDGATISVAEVPFAANSPNAESESGSRSIILIGLVLAALITMSGGIVLRLKFFGGDRTKSLSEPSAFQQLNTAIDSGQVSATNRTLRAWIDLMHPSAYVTSEQFLERHLDTSVPTGLAQLYVAIDAGNSTTGLADLRHAVSLARTNALAKAPKTTDASLQPLNPSN